MSRIQEQVKLENTGKIGHEEPVVSSSFGGRDVVGEALLLGPELTHQTRHKQPMVPFLYSSLGPEPEHSSRSFQSNSGYL